VINITAVCDFVDHSWEVLVKNIHIYNDTITWKYIFPLPPTE